MNHSESSLSQPEPPFFKSILHGADYNPEQWPVEVWDEDVALMQRAHVNVATLPVFGWVTLQPDEETFDFDWLDQIIDKLHAGGVSVCMATATASVPAWLAQKYPDVLRVSHNGQQLKHGNRHTFCPHSPNFQRLSVNLARKLAERYGNHPAIVAWHIGNEYGPTCFCEKCGQAFRVWLQERYGSLEEVNRRWYTSFWGHTYTDWSQIEPPTSNGEGSMQGLTLDYQRFASQSLLGCCCAERDAVREFEISLPITTNMMGTFKTLDYHKWARELDIVSWDCYPQRGAKPFEIAFQHSVMRGLKEGQSWMLMEQTPSQQNWQAYNMLKAPGVMRLWSYQAMAHGADTVMYFQWRRSRGACEKFHGAVVEHSGNPNARVFQEVAELGRELESLGARTLGGRVQSRVALLFDWENWWAIENASGPSVDMKYVPQCLQFYGALHQNGIGADVVSPDADLSGYDLVVAPVLCMVKPGIAEKLEAFVSNGGTFLTTYFSGIVDENDLAFLGGYPGPLRKLLGIWSEELDVLSPAESNHLVFDKAFGELNGSYHCGTLCDRIHTEGAQVLATYGENFYVGEAALTVNDFGKGRAYYLATVPESAALSGILAQLCAEKNIAPPLQIAPIANLEITERVSSDGQSLFYLLNHNAAAVTVSLPQAKFTDLIGGLEYENQIAMPAYGVAILAIESDENSTNA